VGLGLPVVVGGLAIVSAIEGAGAGAAATGGLAEGGGGPLA
jgi:hypothetical protein